MFWMKRRPAAMRGGKDFKGLKVLKIFEKWAFRRKNRGDWLKIELK